jgi:adenylate cyclase
MKNTLINRAVKSRPFLYVLVSGFLAGFLFCLLYSYGALEPLELKSLDHRFARYSGRLNPSDDIVIITIDQNSIDYLKNELHILWKWPRDVYAYTMDYLTASGAKAVVLDFDFSDPDINRAEFEEGQTDIMLGQAIERSGVTITSALFSHEKGSGRFARDSTDYRLLEQFAIIAEGADMLPLADTVHVFAPITPIMRSSRFVGASSILTDEDGITRKLSLLQRIGDRIYPSSSLAAAMTAMDVSSLAVQDGNVMTVGDREIITDSKGGIYLNWYGPGGPEGSTFSYYPIADVFLSRIRMLDGLAPLLPPETFRDKIVLIGSNAPSLYDLKPTPMSGGSAYPGVEIVATATNNLIDGTVLKRESDIHAFITIILACFLSALVFQYLRSPLRSVLAVLTLVLAYYLYAAMAFYENMFVNLVPAGAGIFICFISMTLMNYLTEGREKARVKKAFSQYTSSALMDEILRNPEMLRLGGEKRDLSILFSDIRSFTSISEQLEPEQLTKILNDYLTPMTDVVFRHKGMLDKYIGDAVMAIFGAPLPLKDHPSAACDAALDMISELEALKAGWREMGLPQFIQNMSIGIGINSGPVSVGNMGSNLRFDYTVIGDNVNLSSRLEGTTKVYGVNIVVSENTWFRTRDEFVFRELDFIKVMGKSKPIRIYELMGRKGGNSDEGSLLEKAEEFESGLALYRERRWEEAEGAFNSLLERNGSDKASEVYVNRCRQFIEYPPGEDWDRVFERRTK